MSRATHRLGPALLVATAALSIAWTATPPHELGAVLMGNAAARAGVPPVLFQHWRHRGEFTCRVCHVDVGFAMTRGETPVTAGKNEAGEYCGACHDGKRLHRGKTLLAACSSSRRVQSSSECRACHLRADPAAERRAYEAFAADLPRERSGAIDWERAEAERRIRPADFVDGVSIRRQRLRMDRDVAVQARGSWMESILFSHKKHAVWNGCEVCHPDVFPSTKAGAAQYSMLNITNGQYCGVCHDRVAFGLGECHRCHVKPVR